jgi:A/G-specific adenine glycosylase
LGATVCLPNKPLCLVCPLHSVCVACVEGLPQRYPVRSRTVKRSSQSLWLLWAHTSDGAVWLATRPTPGVWAGLHCFPLFEDEAALRAAVPRHWHAALTSLPAFVHVLTHKDLHLHPWCLAVDASAEFTALGGRWVRADQWPDLGLPAPVRKLLVRG